MEKIAESLVYSLSHMADEAVMKNVFRVMSKHKNFDNYSVELKLKSFVKNNPGLLEELSDNTDSESKITYLQGLQVLRVAPDTMSIEQGKSLLNDSDENVRLEAVKALHFLLPHEKEVEVFSDMRERETSEIIKQEIGFYIGVAK